MRKPVFLAGLLVLTFSMMGLISCHQSEIHSLSATLDRMIADKPFYDAKRELRIDGLRNLKNISNLTPEQEYEVNEKLYQEFKKYQLDSAIYYLERNLSLARMTDETERGYKSAIHLAELYYSRGMSIEAKQLLDSIDPAGLSEKLLLEYYWIYRGFYSQYSVFAGQRRYRQEMNHYLDLWMQIADTSSLSYKLQQYSRLDSPDAEGMMLGVLDQIEPGSQFYASATHSMGSFYERRNNMGLAMKYYMLSAMTDIQNATKENASFQSLAKLYYDQGDLQQAYKYTQAAVDDAIFCNMQFRTVQMSELYSIIIASHQAEEARAKHNLQNYLLLISVLSVVLISLFIYVYKQMHKLYRIKEELSRTNEQLVQLNMELEEKNEQLSDSNAIKEQYIAYFFALCSMYIDKMDDYRKSLKKLAQDRKHEELYRRLESTSMLEEEQEELYKNFDTIFLSLYPSFVEDFNALLTEDEQIILKSDDLLNKELRIYALLRLGITDSVKIASFLRCSLSTVYNYRTKVRNKAAILREEFEKMVMKIGTNRKTKD